MSVVALVRGNLVSARAQLTATLLSSGNVLLAGGSDGHGQVSDSLDAFDPAGFSTSVGSMIDGRARHQAALLANGNVILVGGQINGNCSSASEL